VVLGNEKLLFGVVSKRAYWPSLEDASTCSNCCHSSIAALITSTGILTMEESNLDK
jgi:hypothetical protein